MRSQRTTPEKDPQPQKAQADQTEQRKEQLKAKYASVLELIKKRGVRLAHLHVDKENRLYLEGAAGSEEIKNQVWDEIKKVDATYNDLHCNLEVDPEKAPPPSPRTYTVVKGDSLWKIAKEHYGNGARYPDIIKANPGKLKDENSVIHPGDVLMVPED